MFDVDLNLDLGNIDFDDRGRPELAEFMGIIVPAQTESAGASEATPTASTQKSKLSMGEYWIRSKVLPMFFEPNGGDGTYAYKKWTTDQLPKRKSMCLVKTGPQNSLFDSTPQIQESMKELSMLLGSILDKLTRFIRALERKAKSMSGSGSLDENYTGLHGREVVYMKNFISRMWESHDGSFYFDQQQVYDRQLEHIANQFGQMERLLANDLYQIGDQVCVLGEADQKLYCLARTEAQWERLNFVPIRIKDRQLAFDNVAYGTSSRECGVVHHDVHLNRLTSECCTLLSDSRWWSDLDRIFKECPSVLLTGGKNMNMLTMSNGLQISPAGLSEEDRNDGVVGDVVFTDHDIDSTFSVLGDNGRADKDGLVRQDVQQKVYDPDGIGFWGYLERILIAAGGGGLAWGILISFKRTMDWFMKISAFCEAFGCCKTNKKAENEDGSGSAPVAETVYRPPPVNPRFPARRAPLVPTHQEALVAARALSLLQNQGWSN